MDEQVNPLERDHCLSVVLPGGLEKNATVHGSEPVMDLLVTLCASHHLNPSDYTVEVLSPNKNNISFKPNSPIGSLEADTIVLKPKGTEEKIRRPYMPEPSVRLLINYNKSHKAVVRVSPRVPLEMLLPVVCDKCEFAVETTVLLRDSQSEEPLDLTESLNDLGLREVFAKDTADHQHRPGTSEAAVPPTEAVSPSPPPELPKKEKKQKDNTGFLSLFRRRKKKGEASIPASPAHMGVGASCSNTLPADVPKKRRAPQPPMSASQSVPNLGACHVGGSQRSVESTLRRTKRRAPLPPCANALQVSEADPEVKGTRASLNAAEEELRESDESDSVNLSLPSSSSPSRPSSSSSRPSFARLHEVTLPSFRGRDLSDARCALAKVLTSSVSKGTLVRRLRNSASFPKFYSGSSSLTPRGSGNGAQLEPVWTSKLPTEHEEPPQRKGMTTFKVVPSKTPKSLDPELAPARMNGGDDPEGEAPLEAERPPSEAEEEPPSPDGSDPTPVQSPEPPSQENPSSAPPSPDVEEQESPGSPAPEVGDSVDMQTDEDEPEGECSDVEATGEGQEDQAECRSPGAPPVSSDMDRSAPCPEEAEPPEEVVQEEEQQDRFPPPPPPFLFDEHTEEEDATSSQPPSPTSNGPTRAFGADRRPTQRPPDQTGAARSRFAQAVALAVERSRLQAAGGPLPSPPRSTYQYGA
ncbi:cordon-bleu protein-like 1 [Clinocottus analis]|uniref:cordon-bleu protein-like 1 n=1 Tax=Clinocottus analis TaxID=304258 RepID=UPI0035C0522D